MDWLILILLVPAIIVPIVLLWGFVGCSSFSAADPPSLAVPTNLRAKAESTNLVKLNWQYTSVGPVTFKVERVKEGDSLPKIQDNLPGPLSFDDTMDLTEGTTYFYKIRAKMPSGTESDLSNESSATTFPATPSNVVATPQDVNRIDLSWTNNSPNADGFFILDKLLPAASVTKGSPMPFPVPVLEGSAHEFQVVAFVTGFQENIKQEVRSLPSVPVTAKSLALKAVLTTDQLNRQGRCLVQRIPKGLLKNKGPQVKITVRGSSANSLTIDRIYISRPAAAGNLWDSLPLGTPGGLTKVVDKDLGDPVVSLLAGKPWTSGLISYNLDQTNDLLIAFDISTDMGQGNLISVALLGATAYLRANTQQAAVTDRGPGYTDDPNTLYLVEKIEVS